MGTDLVVDLSAGLVEDSFGDVTNTVGVLDSAVVCTPDGLVTVMVLVICRVTVVLEVTSDEAAVGGDEDEGEAAVAAVDEAGSEVTVMPRVSSAVFTSTQPISTPAWTGSGIAKQLTPLDLSQVANRTKVLELASHFMTLPPMQAVWPAEQRESRVSSANAALAALAFARLDA